MLIHPLLPSFVHGCPGYQGQSVESETSSRVRQADVQPMQSLTLGQRTSSPFAAGGADKEVIVVEGRGGSASLKSERTLKEIRDIDRWCRKCLETEGVITRIAYLRIVRPEIGEAEDHAEYVHAAEQAAIHLLKETCDVRNTGDVLRRAGVEFPRERRKKLAA